MADARKRKPLPGIAKKPQGFTSLQLLANARNERWNQRPSKATHQLPVQKEVTIWMKLHLLMINVVCTMMALFKRPFMAYGPIKNRLHEHPLSKYIGACLAILALCTVASFGTVISIGCQCDCIRAAFKGKQEKANSWYEYNGFF